MEQIPHSHRLTRENNGLANIESYQNCPLPEEFEITELLGGIIQVEYADVAGDGISVVRNGIILPADVVDHKAWRVGKVTLAGPECRQVKVGNYVMFPGDKGLPGLTKKGKTVVFLDETRIFGICSPVKE